LDLPLGFLLSPLRPRSSDDFSLQLTRTYVLPRGVSLGRKGFFFVGSDTKTWFSPPCPVDSLSLFARAREKKQKDPLLSNFCEGGNTQILVSPNILYHPPFSDRIPQRPFLSSKASVSTSPPPLVTNYSSILRRVCFQFPSFPGKEEPSPWPPVRFLSEILGKPCRMHGFTFLEIFSRHDRDGLATSDCLPPLLPPVYLVDFHSPSFSRRLRGASLADILEDVLSDRTPTLV